jgi:hypothetical protein
LRVLDVENTNSSIRGSPVDLVGLVLVWFQSGFGLVWSGWSGFSLAGLVLVRLPGDPLMEDLGALDVESPNSSIRGSPVGLVGLVLVWLVWFWSGCPGVPDRRFWGFGRRKL